MKSLRERAKPIRTEIPVHIPTADGKTIAETIMVTVDAIKDPKTGEVYLSGDALEELSRIKARYMGVLLPSEIRGMRERLGLTQKQMSELFLIGEKSYSRWENGRERPSQSMNRLLVALWEGRLSVADLTSMRRPVYPWYERITGICPCGSEHKSTPIAANVEIEEEPPHEIRGVAA